MENAVEPPATASALELAIGDSLTNGHQDPNPSSSYEAYPHQLATTLGANSYKQPQSNSYVLPAGWLTYNGSSLTAVNYGIESQTLDQMINTFNSQVLANAGSYNSTTVTLLGGTNNIISGGDSAQQIYQKWETYAALCAANNIRVRIMTIPAMNNSAWNAVAFAANAQLRADHSFANEFVDLARNTVFVEPTNLYYYSADTIHLKTPANQKMAELILAARNNTLVYPSITTSGLSAATLNTYYSQAVSATGNPSSWQHKSGALPSGMSFNGATGRFEGTPTQNGIFNNIVIWAINGTGNFDEKTFSLTVNIGGTTPTPTPTATPTPTPTATPTPTTTPTPSGATFTDDFDRSNGVIGNGWEVITTSGFSTPTALVSNNQLVMTGSSNGHGYVRPDALRNGSSEIKFLGGGSASGVAAVARVQANGEGYIGYAAQVNGYTNIYRVTASGGYVALGATVTHALAAGDTLKLRVEDSTLTLSYIRGGVETMLKSVNDTSISGAGKFGFYSDSQAVRVDDFKMINAAGGTATTTTTFTDDFDRSNGVIGNGWEVITTSGFSTPTALVSNNQLVMTGSSNGHGYVRPDALRNGSSEIKFLGGGSASGVAAVARVQANGEGYIGYAAQVNGYTNIYRVTASGGYVALGATVTHALAAGDTLKLRVEDSTLTLSYIRGGVETMLKSVNDTTVTNAGRFGFYSDLQTARVDDYKMTNAAGGTATTTTTFTDDFDRSNGVIGNGWEVITTSGFSTPTALVSNNQLVMTGSSNGHGYVRPDALRNGSSEIKFLGGGSASGVAAVARVQANGEGYIGYAAQVNGYTNIYRVTASGGYVALGATVTHALAAGDTLKLRVEDSTLTLSYIRGGVETMLKSVNDTTVTNAGRFGFYSDLQTARVDDYKMTNAAGGTATTTTTFTDDFDRSNGVIGNGWEVITTSGFSTPTALVSNNQLVMTGSSNGHGYVRPDALRNGSSEIKFLGGGSASGVAAVARVQANGEGYIGYAAQVNGYTNIYRVTASGGYVALGATVTHALAAGDTLKLRVEDSTLTLSYIRGGVETMLKSVNDTTVTNAGRFGFYSDLQTVRVDDFKLVQ